MIVVLDTMRRGVLSAYGGQAKTPNIDALASDGVVYRDCIASSPWTAPSHASLFTGLLPSAHGVHETWEKKIVEVFGSMKDVQAEPLASYLTDRGYDTACYSANANLGPGSGFERGFSHFRLVNVTVPDEEATKAVALAKKYGKTKREAALNLAKQGKVGELVHLFKEDRRLKREHRRRNFPRVKGGEGITSLALSQRLEQPFFLFVNLLEMHEPYTSGDLGGEPRPISDLFGTRPVSESLMAEIRRKYAEEASVVDGFVGRILGRLKSSRAYEDSLVVVTSDHGQGLKERGFFGHGTFLHEEVIGVPLIVKYPKGARPKQAAGYQPLHRVQELVKDSLIGVNDGLSLHSDHAVAESFGVPFGVDSVSQAPDFAAKRERYDRPRKAVYRSGLKLVVDGKDGSIEEFSRAGEPADPQAERKELQEMVALLAQAGDGAFVLPSVG